MLCVTTFIISDVTKSFIIQDIIESIVNNRVRITDHADEESQADNLRRAR